MKFKWIENEFTYDGTQLRSLFGYLDHDLLGDSIVSWQGPCNITFEHMVDGEDLKEKAEIKGSKMLHFIVEKFNCELFGAVAMQRLLSSMVIDEVYKLTSLENLKLKREGDDIFWGGKKLSISIATKSPTSSMIHFALNISNKGTPVPTCSLEDLKVDPIQFSKHLMESFCKEVEQISQATQKVHWIR